MRRVELQAALRLPDRAPESDLPADCEVFIKADLTYIPVRVEVVDNFIVILAEELP